MARKKAENQFLTKEQFEEFVLFLKEKKVRPAKVAKIQGVSSGTVSTWFKKKEITHAVRENVVCRIENKDLRERLDKINSVIDLIKTNKE